jgi:hypothetical protein
MNEIFIWFWTILIFASIVWYGFLVFYIGAKGGSELKAMIKTLDERPRDDKER